MRRGERRDVNWPAAAEKVALNPRTDTHTGRAAGLLAQQLRNLSVVGWEGGKKYAAAPADIT